MNSIIRGPAEVNAAGMRAQKASFAAEDAGDTDDAAEAVYTFYQWLTGNTDVDPTEEMG